MTEAKTPGGPGLRRRGMSTTRTTILVPVDLLQRLDRLARTGGRTKTALIVEALRAYVDAAEAPRGRLPFVGVGRSGHGRLSLDASRIAAREMGETRR
jgi:Ribbon-helix-helix protein, copG family